MVSWTASTVVHVLGSFDPLGVLVLSCSRKYSVYILVNGATPWRRSSNSELMRVNWASPRERGRAAMAALNRRIPNLDDFVGLNWSCWVDRVNILPSDGEFHSLPPVRCVHPVVESTSCDIFAVLFSFESDIKSSTQTKDALGPSAGTVLKLPSPAIN